jgi:hypothetical protein
MRLLRAELSRLFARRFTTLMLLAVVVALGIVGAVTASETHRPAPAEVQRAETAAADAKSQCQQALRGPQDPNLPPVSDADCDQISGQDYLPYILNFQEQMPELLLMLAGLLALFGYLVGASVVGAEWSSGGMTNLLLWRSERIRVLLAKLAAVALGVFGVGVLLGAGWLGTIWLIARYRGAFGQLTEAFWISLGWDAARGMGLALCLALAGAALASLGRRTAAALGVVVGYLVIWEFGGRIVMTMLRLSPDRYTLSTYATAFLTRKVELYQCDASGETCREFVVPWQQGVAVVAGLTLLIVLAAAWSLRRRDVA